MFKIGLSTCHKTVNEELFASYKSAGLKTMEICVDKTQYDSIDYKAIHSLSAKYGIELWSFHLPFVPFGKINPAYSETKEFTLKYFGELIKKATDIGITRFVVHPSGEPIKDEMRNAQMECAKDSLARLADIAEKEGAVIAVEDLPRTCLGRNSGEILELIGVHDSLRVCLDTNHLLSEDIVDFIHRVGNKIITTHISDYDFVDERHWLPGEGKLDWQRIVRALKDIDYNGAWMYEISFVCPETIKRNRPLACDDFVRNAAEIFENKEITVFSEHILDTMK